MKAGASIIIYTKMASVNEVGEELSRQELLDAQAHVWHHVFNFINSMSLKCAIQLSIPDIIHKHGKPMTLSELANAIPINKAKSNGLYRLMRVLVHSKFFDKVKISESDDEEEEEAYCLTQASRLLLKDGPMSMACFALGILDPIKIDPWHHLSEWFQNEDPSSFVTNHGAHYNFEGIEQKWTQLYNAAMAGDAGFVSSILTKECKQVFEGLKSLVDVGGGPGFVAKAISDAFPGLKCTVLELPHVVAGLEGADNLTYVGGDMFEFIPHADAVFLKWMLQNRSDEDCVRILKKCKEAITPSKSNGGKVLIVEIVVNDQKEKHDATETQLFLDLQMMVEEGGKQRTEKEWAELFSAAGFGNYKITPILGLRSLIEVFP